MKQSKLSGIGLAIGALCAACAAEPEVGDDCLDGAGTFAVEVVSARYGPGQSFGRDAMPEVVLGPPHGAGCCQGSLDVVSLGNGGEIVLSFGPSMIIDAPGPDLVVFENPFESQGAVFAELAEVAVSTDGVEWHAFACEPGGSTAQCAGKRPVYLDGDTGPLDPDTSGGDPFDLADVGLAEARLVRVVDRADLVGQDGVFDLDAVGAVHAACR